jgi:hypothetical protein
MVIKNKDGSVLRPFSKPNPIMSKQDLWEDGTPLILHNFDAEPVKKYQPLEEIVPQEIKVVVKETTPEKKVRKKNIVLLYCMPATTTDFFDPLYNENRATLTFGQQFTFEAIVTNSTDLTLQLWTTKELTKNSILYQPSSRRWWNAEAITKDSDGFVIDCMPSSLQPSFRT